MKKYLLTSAAALAFCGLFTSCTHDFDNDGGSAAQNSVVKTYEQAFVTAFGQPDPNNEWGFGTSTVATTRALTRSQTAPACPDIQQPYDETWVTNYMETATEPTQANTADNGGAIWTITQNSRISTLIYNYNWAVGQNGVTQKDKDYYTTNILPLINTYGNNPYSMSKENQMKFLPAFEGNGGYDYWGIACNFVTEFKITQNYTGTIGVAASEGYASSNGQNGELVYGDRLEPFLARTIVVKNATWSITDNQRIGSGGLIVVANGGTINIAEGKTLELVNHARLVVLRGGTVTGAGNIAVTNGNGTGDENYNAGTISITGRFNNNFGKFYNYGLFKPTQYAASSKESNFYNHGIVHINNAGQQYNYLTPNARIYNACQWYCEQDMRCYIYEGVMGSSFIVGGKLEVSFSNDGTSDPTYFSLAAGALVKCGYLFNNGTSWSGPTSGGYAALEIDHQISYMNWTQDHPEEAGYFINNLYIKAGDLSNNPDGNNVWVEGVTMNAEYKLKNVVGNKGGNGNMKVIGEGNTQIIDASEGFVLGESGCTPGFRGDESPNPDPDPDPNAIVIRVICEDLSVKESTDWDFNDVVFDIQLVENNQAEITLLAAGGTLPLYIGDEDHEVHDLFAAVPENSDKGITRSTMINTGSTGNKYNLRNCKEAIFRLDILSDWTAGAGPSTSEEDLLKIVAKNLPVKVLKLVNGEKKWVTLMCEPGKATAKVAVNEDFEWCDEREHINDKYEKYDVYRNGYGGFSLFVQGFLDANDWYNYNGPLPQEMVNQLLGQ